MEKLVGKFRQAQTEFKKGNRPLDLLGVLSSDALKLLGGAIPSVLPNSSAGEKQYSVYRVTASGTSRPYLPRLFISDSAEFRAKWTQMIHACNSTTKRIELAAYEVNRIMYTAVMSFCLCFDLWKPRSRKSPGTQFEIVLGSILAQLLPNYSCSAHVPLPNDEDKVATDIVLTHPRGDHAIVFAVKITTRERIVQPFAHQRILDSVFGVGRYQSLVVCVSEMQRDEEMGANEVCVPGTIRLFQKHLAPVAGLYYLDPPHRYLQKDLTSIIRVGSMGELLTNDLAALVE